MSFTDALDNVSARGRSCHNERVGFGDNSALEIVASVEVYEQDGEEDREGDERPNRSAVHSKTNAEGDCQEQNAECGEADADVVAGFEVPRQEAIGVGDCVTSEVIFSGEFFHFA